LKTLLKWDLSTWQSKSENSIMKNDNETRINMVFF
jgi:hypothetical protein